MAQCLIILESFAPKKKALFFDWDAVFLKKFGFNVFNCAWCGIGFNWNGFAGRTDDYKFNVIAIIVWLLGLCWLIKERKSWLHGCDFGLNSSLQSDHSVHDDVTCKCIRVSFQFSQRCVQLKTSTILEIIEMQSNEMIIYLAEFSVWNLWIRHLFSFPVFMPSDDSIEFHNDRPFLANLQLWRSEIIIWHNLKVHSEVWCNLICNTPV